MRPLACSPVGRRYSGREAAPELLRRPYPMLQRERQDVARFMRRLYRQGLTTTSGGNLSCRVAGTDRILLTASKSDKSVLRWNQVAVLAMAGENLTPELVPSIETSMHLEIYRRYPEIGAVVHAHPPTASAFCATNAEINCRLIAESYAILREPVVAPYALMGTQLLAENVAEAVALSPCVLLVNHGVLTTGSSLLEAFDRLEVLEAAARLTLTTRQIGEIHELTQVQLNEIDKLMGRNRD